MESCRSVLPPISRNFPHPPTCRRLPPKVYSTLGKLIEVLEQLEPSEDLRSLLQRLVAEVGDKSPSIGLGSRVELDPGTIIRLARILDRLNAPQETDKVCGQSAMNTLQTHGTTFASSAGLERVSDETPGPSKVGGERVSRGAPDGRSLSLSKQDSLYLMKKIRDFEQKCKPLQEKNKKFLERNMELTTLNKSLREQIRNIADENKKMKEQLDETRRKCCGLSRQLSDVQSEKDNLKSRVQEVDRLRAELVENAKNIAAMKQTAAEKDRRMEVLQHRKKRRLRLSPEYLSRLSSPCSGTDDERSQDSDFSMSSVSSRNLSDVEDNVEELPEEELEKLDKNYRKLMKEHLNLQKSTAKLQATLGWGLDPDRYIKTRLDFETDLYVSRCKIENLEECLEKYKDSDMSWTMEKEELTSDIQAKLLEISTQSKTIKELQTKLGESTAAYEELKEQSENLEFLVLETQENNRGDVLTEDASTNTEELDQPLDTRTDHNNKQQTALDLPNHHQAIRKDKTSQTDSPQTPTMSHSAQGGVLRASIQGLEDKLTQLMKGHGSEVATVMIQLRQADQNVIDVIEVETTMQDLQGKIGNLQQDNITLNEKLARYHERLDSQEQSLSLTRDEREELLQVKRKGGESQLNNRLRLAEVGQQQAREKSLERAESWERLCSPMMSPRSPSGQCHFGDHLALLKPALGSKSGEKELAVGRVLTGSEKHFDSHMEATDFITPTKVSETETSRKFRINSVPTMGTDRLANRDMFSEVDKLQGQIQDLQDENDVLKFELTQKGHGDSDTSGSDTEDTRVAELRETCENLRERLRNAEALERQCKDRLKLAEKHIMELELGETVLRDRVEEGNADCDKLRKQIVRLQRKIRELKDVASDKEASEQGLMEKVKYLEETDALLSNKVTELEGTNHILKQRLDVKDELLADVQLVETLTNQVKALQAENNDLESKLIDLEENNDVLKENWRKVADEEADRRECLEEKVRVLESVNKELKTKIKDQETDLDLSATPSIASEINEDVIEQLNERIKELEGELKSVKDQRDKKIESLEDFIGNLKENEAKLSETLQEMENNEQTLQEQIDLLEKSKSTTEAASEMSSYEDKLSDMRTSHEDLLERLDSMENHEDDFKERMIQMEKSHEKKLIMLEREIAELQQQEDDLCTRIEELEENENVFNEKLNKWRETEMNYKNKIEEFENRETSLTIQFSQRVEELEQNGKQMSEKFYLKIEQLESNEENLKEKVKCLEIKNKDLMEKHENELSEKVQTEQFHAQENLALVQSEPAANGAMSVIVQETFESVAKVESEASVVANMEGASQVDYNVLVNENQKLKEEKSKLQVDLEQSEKEQKSLEEKLKRQEKKRKRSERSEKSDDYDTIAREVVTYKMEVEQLRGENNDLHERVMELDESEKTLQEENEKLEKELKSRKDCDLSSEREQVLVNRINELETVEQNLTEQIYDNKLEKEVHTSEEHSELESNIIKDTVDVSVGTDDFMEGVMAGQEQGKPVSSMFERIQKMETENNELSTKLSTLTATDAQVRQLSDKVKSLEENEDSLMERVMELEEEEDRLKRELNKVRNSVTAVDDLENEITELHEKEGELSSTVESLKLENVSLKKTMESSDSEKGGIAVRLASIQKKYEDEKKKVESLLKGEERLMKSMSSEKKKIQEVEDELSSTQEKLEELQTEYEHKLTEKDESEKIVKDELNKFHREKQMLQKKLQEFEKSNSELEDEIEHCKISESRMFHRLQTLNTQNEELELKLSKLVKLIPHAGSDTIMNKDKSSHLMSENPEVISENPLSSSIFTEKELDLLRSKTPELDLLGSVPLDMLRKIKDFDQREHDYQSKIHDLESKNVRSQRKATMLQSKEKDLKHEIKELQLELMKFRAKKSKLRASNSSLEMEKSGSEDGVDSDTQSVDDADEHVEIFKADEVEDNDYDSMTQEELLLSVKLLNEKQNQDTKMVAELEKHVSALEEQRNVTKNLLEKVVLAASCENTADCLQNIQTIRTALEQQDQQDSLRRPLTGMLNLVTSLRQRLEALQDMEETLRLSLAENEVVSEQLREDSQEKIKQLESQIHVLAKVAQRYQSIEKRDSSCQTSLDNSQRRYSTSRREFHLEPSKTINIDVLPSKHLQSILNLQCLEQSETIHVNVPPTRLSLTGVESDEDYSDTGYFGYPESSVSAAMMEKAEDVLRQRIRELEKLEKHLRQQVSDLESDREELHEIARKDKTIIHEQNVAIRQLELAQRNTQEQVKSYEKNENSLYARLDELEAEMDNKDDRIRDLEVLEGRLKDLVKQYKLDEKILQTKSDTLESSVMEMSQKEETLRQKVQNLETEKTAFSQRSEYLQLRLKEIEGAELDLAHRAKNQENIMQTLQSTVIELETYGANAHARVVELEHVNFDLQQRLHHAMTENSPLSKRAAGIQQQCDQMESELTLLRDLEIKLRQENESLVKNENSRQQEVKGLRLRGVEMEGRLRDVQEGESIMKDRLGKLQRSENTLKYRVQELESSGIQAPSDLNTTPSGSIKLPRTLEECQRRIIVLQTNNAELQSRLQNHNNYLSNTSPQEVSSSHSGLVSIPQAEYQSTQRKLAVSQHIGNQLTESDRLNTHLQGTIAQLREGKDVCGHEVEIEVLRQRLDDANSALKMLQNQTPGQWDIQGQNGEVPKPGSGQSRGQEALIEETMAQTSAGSLRNSRPPGRGLSRDALLDDLLGSLHMPNSGNHEDKHWHEIEARMEAARRGGEQWISVGKATSLYANERDPHAVHLNRSHGKDEELELNVALQSETESQNYSQNDIDSCRYGNGLSPGMDYPRHNSELYSSVQRNSKAPSLPENGPPFIGGGNVRGADNSFVDSLTLQDSYDDLSDQHKDVVYRRSGGSPSLVDSVADSGRGTASVSIATSAMTLRERIQHIEKQLSARESDSAHEMHGEMEMTSWKARVHESNRRLELAERETKHIKDEINRLEKELEEKCRLFGHLEAFLHAIQDILAHKDSLDNSEVIEKVEDEVNKVVSSLADKGHRPDNISNDPAALSTELAKRDRELVAKRNEADSLLIELRRWQEECRTIEDMRTNALDSLRGLEVEVAGLQQTDARMRQVNSDYGLLKGQTGDSEMGNAGQRTRVVQLANLCNEKDMLIKKLVQELRKLKSGATSSPLVEELYRLDARSDHNHNHLRRTPSQTSLDDSMDRMSVVSDTELLHETSPSLAQRPRSADIGHHRNAPHRASYHGHSGNTGTSRPRSAHHSASPIPRMSSRSANYRSAQHSPLPPHLAQSPRWSSHNSQNRSGDLKTTQYVAIADYDPSMFTQSGHPRLELPLKEGDLVLVTGPLHDSGYVEGEVRGRVGLVPLSYLQPCSPHRRAGAQRSVPGHLNASPERIAQLYQSLHNVHVPNTHGFPNGIPSGATELPGNRRSVPMATSPPDAPGNFHVEKIIGNNSLMLAWQPVTLDNNGCNNGVKVTGYKIYKNGKLCVQPRGRHASKAIIENISIQQQHRFGIKTVCVEGRASELSEVMYEGVQEVTSDENSDTESEMDMAHILNVDEYKSGHKRMFMGVYDYDPSKNSPYEHPTCELAFNAGDIIAVYGRQRGDGFYYAELNGARGLVPTFFIEEMPQPPPRTKKIAARNKHVSKEKSGEKMEQ